MRFTDKKCGIGVICAMEPEARHIIAAMEKSVTETTGCLTVTSGVIGNTRVTVGCGAYGKVSAAVCATLMVEKYGVCALVNSGVAGGIDPGLEPGDAVVASSVVQHDYDTSPIGDPVGMISGLNITEIQADGELSDRLCRAALENGIRIKRGIIATGDSFIADRERAKRIRDLFGAVACDMESGSVGQTAYLLGIPFAIIRAISDNGNGKAAEDFPAFTEMAAERAARTFLTMINGMERE